MAGKHIVLITTGQPSTNPRLVKEADTLQANGYQVTVLYAYWNQWATETDQHLLKNKSWLAIRVGGNPFTERIAHFRSRLTYLMCKKFLIYWIDYTVVGFQFSRFKVPNWVLNGAIARPTTALINAAKRLQADLYLAHNLGAIPAAVNAAKVHKSKAGFDAEDYHRNEITDDLSSSAHKLNKALEDRYIPELNYFTVSSPLIKALYDQHYKINSTVIRNLFPKFHRKEATTLKDRKPIRLCWCSQTIGQNRGLELLIVALRSLNPGDFELHLIGELKLGFKEHLARYSNSSWLDLNVTFHAPVKPDTLFTFLSTFDIGIASEPAFCTNNNVALSNKVFSYIQCGLALLLSDTAAQSAFFNEYPGIGKLYQKDSKEDLTKVIRHYIEHPDDLEKTKKHNYILGQEIMNWEREQTLFLQQIEHVLHPEGPLKSDCR
jgi:hypothetical protein